MARPLRIHIPDKVYHLFARGNNKAPIFRENGDFHRFLELLAGALARFRVECISYCLLSNHYHALVIPRVHSVSRLMHQVNGSYCRWFNRRHGRVGHVLQGRFGSRIVDDNDYLLTALRYVAMNPVAAGCSSRPDDWTWSSYRAIAGLCETPPFLTLDPVWRAFGCLDDVSGRPRYIAHVGKEGPVEELQDAVLFGGDLLARIVRPLLEPHREDRAFLYEDRFATRPPLGTLFVDVDSTASARHAAWTAFHTHAYTLGEIGEVVGRSPSTISRWIHRIDIEAGQNGHRIGRSWHENIRSARFKL
jgi:REP element-mobilizing transposase RayT